MNLEDKITTLLKDADVEDKELVGETIAWFLEKAKSNNSEKLPNNWRTQIEKIVHKGKE
jgi:DNA-binding ferritin-like protein (Dps family)